MTDSLRSGMLTGFTEPVMYTRDALSSVPNGAGVHVVWGPGDDDDIVYVGHTGKLRDRLRQHLTGDRQASVLFEQVAALLDGDDPDSAGREEVAEWLASCRFAWKEARDPANLKRQLLQVLNPRFNRLNATPQQATGVWWVNQGRSFDEERSRWMIFAGTERSDGRHLAHHQVLADLRPGDVTLHYVRGALRAMGVVHAPARKTTRPYGATITRDSGLAVRVEYFELGVPIPLNDLPSRHPGVGPFDRNANVQQIYCTAVQGQWAEQLRAAFPDRWPAGSPWSSGRSFWVFQAQPDQWDLVAHLHSMPPGHHDTWTATKHRARMKAGDGVALWSGGSKAGFYALARLTGPPELRPTPDFRPESAGDEEWRAPLVITAHLLPPLLKAAVQAQPGFAGLSVLRTPWAGTNQPMTVEEWRTVVAAVGLEDPMADRWESFVHWAQRLSEAYDLEADEREYKLEIARLLDQGRTALASDEPWIEPLKLAIRHRDNNLVSWRLKFPFLGWVEQNSEEAGAALAPVWDDSIDGAEAIERFAAALPTTLVSGVGTRTGLASLLRMAVDVETNPVIRPRTFRAAYALTGFESTDPPTERTTWEDGVRFCDTFIAEAAVRGLEIRDRLDAQGLIWMVINNDPAAAWPLDEQAAFMAYRAGDVESAGADRLSELVRAFRSETGYPAEGNPQRDREREELAAAFTPEALDVPDLPTLRRLAGPAYGSPGPQPGFNKLLQSEETAGRVAKWLRELLYGTDLLESRIANALTGSGALPGVKEAIVTKALAVTDPGRWFPSYVFPNADIYQLLAYTTALDLADGLLIYAAGEYPAGTHTISRADKRLHVVMLDLAGDPTKVLSEIRRLALRVRELALPVAA